MTLSKKWGNDPVILAPILKRSWRLQVADSFGAFKGGKVFGCLENIGKWIHCAQGGFEDGGELCSPESPG